MARKAGNIPCSLWKDPTFTRYTRNEQIVYMCLLTQRNLDAAGVLPLTPDRWARMLDKDWTRSDLLPRLAELEDGHFVEVDYGTEEVFVSGYFASELVGRQPRRAAAAHDAIALVYSPRLRAVAGAELAEEFWAAGQRTPRGIRAVVLERDGYRCCHCGWEPAKRPGSEGPGSVIYRALEVDHIHPRALGGGDDLPNLQTLCTLCNTLKGAKV